jgi:LCP family protein required for cell wall assembly
MPSLGPSPAPSAQPAGPDELLGTDGRFTILLLGSDYRPAHPGNRTDAIMVVSLDPSTGKVAAFSVPRDTTKFPLPGGGTYGPKVTGLYQYFQAKNGKGLASMEEAIAKAYGIEVDYGVLTGFAGVRQLVTAVGGVAVTMEQAYYDPVYWVTSKKRGWGLSVGRHILDGPNALIFARSRHGDNDFNRARRQQQLVAAAVSTVLDKGPDILPTLLSIADGTTTTDLPLLRVLDMYALVKTADLTTAQRAVFGPRTYATGAGGSNFTPNIAASRAWIKDHFPPAKPGAVWPPKS